MTTIDERLAAKRRRKQALLPQVTRLAREGYSHEEIGKMVGAAKSTVGFWLHELRRDHSSWALVDNAHIVALTLRRYHQIYREAMKAFRRSQEEKQVRMVEESGGDGSDGGHSRKKKSIRSEGRAGDPAFLGKAMEALKAIRQIEGIDTPRRTDITRPGDGPINLATLEDEDPRNLTNEQLVELEREMAARIVAEEKCEGGFVVVHDLHQAGLSAELASPGVGRDAERGRGGDLPAADGLHAAPARQE